MAYRIEFFGDEVDRITEVDVLTGEIKNELNHVAIFPASHYVVSKESMERAIRGMRRNWRIRSTTLRGEGKLLEAQRISEYQF